MRRENDSNIQSTEQNGVSLDDTSSLYNLPNEILFYIVKLIETENVANTISIMLSLRCVSKRFNLIISSNKFFNDTLTDILRIASRNIDYPSPSALKKLEHTLTNYPILLFLPIANFRIERNGTNYTYNNYTLFQLAYAEGDELTSAMLKRLIVRACGNEIAGQKEICKQISEKFSQTSSMQCQGEKIADIMNQLIDAVARISFDSFDPDIYPLITLEDSTYLSIDAFDNQIKELLPVVINNGVRFDLNFLIKAVESYKTREMNLDFCKRRLIEEAAISFILRFLAMNDAMKLCQGVNELYCGTHSKPFQGKTVLNNSDFFRELQTYSNKFMQVNGITIVELLRPHEELSSLSLASQLLQRLNKIYQAKTESLKSLQTRTNQNDLSLSLRFFNVRPTYAQAVKGEIENFTTYNSLDAHR